MPAAAPCARRIDAGRIPSRWWCVASVDAVELCVGEGEVDALADVLEFGGGDGGEECGGGGGAGFEHGGGAVHFDGGAVLVPTVYISPAKPKRVSSESW